MSEETLNQIIRYEVSRIIKRYKIDKQDAEIFLQDELESTPEIQKLVSEKLTFKQIKIRSVYKEFIKEVRKKIYYQLRTYYPSFEEKGRIEIKDVDNLTEETILRILKTHVSTSERMSSRKKFNQFWIENFKEVESIIDVGCGVFPLMFPFGEFNQLEKYHAIDNDSYAIDVLDKYSKLLDGVDLESFDLDLKDLLWKNFENNYDLAIMLKLVPVIARQDREHLEKLFNVPAKKVVVSASKESMTKKVDISAREDAVLNRFIDNSGRKIIRKFSFGKEFGYVLE